MRMNIHSHDRRSAVTHLPSLTPPDAPLSERHIRILDAAERVFARAGFHAATMNDVAGEAGMSPGNIYRYFASKDAIIAGMAERDRMEIAEDFAALDPAKGGLLDQLEALGRRHMVDESRDKAVLALLIWAESSRNPAMASMCASIDSTVARGLSAAVAAAKANGELPANLDDGRFLQAIFMMADGFFCGRAANPDFDTASAADTLFIAMRALAQSLVLPPSDGDRP